MAQSVTVDFNANIARFSTAIDKATNDLSKFQSHAERVSANIQSAFSNLGIGLSIAGFVAFVKNAIDAADHMHDLAASTRLTVEQLAGLNLAAKQTGSDLDGIAAAINKMSVNMGKDPLKFAEIGVISKDKIEALQQFADVFVGIKDPQLQAAAAAAAFGKQWAVIAPLLAEGGDAIGKMVEKGIALSGTINDMANRSDAFNDKLAEMHQKTQGLITNALTPLLPLMLTTADYISDTGDKAKAAGENMGILTIAFQAIVVTGANVAYVLKETGIELGGIAAQINALAHGDIQGFNAISTAMKKDAEEARKVLEEFEQKIMNPQKPEDKAKPSSTFTSNDAVRKFIGGEGIDKESAINKKLLENNLKMLESAAKNEEDILASRNKMLDFFYGENLLSVNGYYKAKQDVQNSATENMIADYDKEIAILEKYRSHAIKDVDKIEATGKINDLLEKKNKLITDAGESATVNFLQEEKATKDLNNAISELNSRYLEMNNRLGEAAGLQFDLTNQQLKTRLTTQDNTEALAELDKLKARAVENASTNAEAGFSRSMRNYVNIASDSAKQIEDVMTNAFKGMEDALVTFVTTGKLDFNSLANSIVADITRMTIRQNITGPLAQMLIPTQQQSMLNEQWAGSSGGISGIIARLFGSAKGNVFSGNGISSYENTIVTKPTLFANGGNVMGEAGPEAIIPLKRDSNGKLGISGGGMTVNNHFVITGPVDNRSQGQIAASVYAGITRAARRNS